MNVKEISDQAKKLCGDCDPAVLWRAKKIESFSAKGLRGFRNTTFRGTIPLQIILLSSSRAPTSAPGRERTFTRRKEPEHLKRGILGHCIFRYGTELLILFLEKDHAILPFWIERLQYRSSEKNRCPSMNQPIRKQDLGC